MQVLTSRQRSKTPWSLSETWSMSHGQCFILFDCILTPVKTNILNPKHAGLEDVFPFHKKRSSDFPQKTIFRFHGSFRWPIRYVASLEIMNIAKESGTVSCAFYLFQGNTFLFKCWKVTVKVAWIIQQKKKP